MEKANGTNCSNTTVSNPKPYNGGQWTLARQRSFVMSALRRARWPQKFVSVRNAYVADGTNPRTGRTCKLHRCEQCHNQFPQSQIQADHKEPVIPVDGKWGDTIQWLGYNWNELLQRLYCDADGFSAICKQCHKTKTSEERKQRKESK